jgi:hypothetical protein
MVRGQDGDGGWGGIGKMGMVDDVRGTMSIVLPVVVSAIIVFPSHKNNVYMSSKVYCYFVWERKFLAVRRVGLMTHREYRVDRPFPVT